MSFASDPVLDALFAGDPALDQFFAADAEPARELERADLCVRCWREQVGEDEAERDGQEDDWPDDGLEDGPDDDECWP